MTPTAEESLLAQQQARIARALDQGQAMRWTKTAAGWKVQTGSGACYQVSRDGRCTCPDFQFRSHRIPGGCKHLIGLAVHLVKGGLL